MNNQEPKLKITIDGGCDCYSLMVTGFEYARILQGEKIEIQGNGMFIEGERHNDTWAFNSDGKGTLEVSCDSGFVAYTGGFKDGLIAVEDMAE